MGWEVIATSGATSLSLTERTKFDLRWQKNINDLGVVQHVDYTLEIEGDVRFDAPAGTPEQVADEFVNLSKEVTERFQQVTIELKLDGVRKFLWEPSAGFNGPHITHFASLAEDGNADSHWRFAMSVFFKGKGDPDNNDLANLQLSLNVRTIRENIVRKIWKARGKAVDAGTALAAIREFRPNSKELDEDETEFFTEASASATWIWDALQDIAETVTIQRGFKDFVEDPQAGVGKSPVLHLRQRGATIVTIQGTKRNYGPDIVAPPKHFTENGSDTFEATARAPLSQVRIDNAVLGIFALDYMEVWMFTGDVPPANHNGENHTTEIKFSSNPPDDGKMADLRFR